MISLSWDIYHQILVYTRYLNYSIKMRLHAFLFWLDDASLFSFNI